MKYLKCKFDFVYFHLRREIPFSICRTYIGQNVHIWHFHKIMFKNHKYHLHNICHSCLKTLVKEQNCLQSPWFAQNNFHLFIFNPPLWLLGLAPLWAFGLPSVAFSPSVSYHTSTLHWSLWSWTAAVKPPKMTQRCLQILTPRIRDSCSCSCCVTKKMANTLSKG